ncbi:protein of unknown function [Cupriavidus neocaledonicus]|uniref:Uncharacterized protein n=1 Tax=Cupriavidus neocaledonicus TaxID=1040979 RepID=A0A375H6B8_9BURK|nr:hypothetical protein CBM2605_A60473 [Cupriavidus neocaledonicus]SPD45809.1 protein of unknown function [Cupriavidus neocaledonicus]
MLAALEQLVELRVDGFKLLVDTHFQALNARIDRIEAIRDAAVHFGHPARERRGGLADLVLRGLIQPCHHGKEKGHARQDARADHGGTKGPGSGSLSLSSFEFDPDPARRDRVDFVAVNTLEAVPERLGALGALVVKSVGCGRGHIADPVRMAAWQEARVAQRGDCTTYMALCLGSGKDVFRLDTRCRHNLPFSINSEISPQTRRSSRNICRNIPLPESVRRVESSGCPLL